MRLSKTLVLASLSLILGFGVLSRPSMAAPAVVDRLEASVNSSLILLSDIQRFRHTAELRAQLDPLFSGTTVAAQGPKATTRDIVDFLIDERIISQQFPMGDLEVDQEIKQIQSTNKIDRSTLKNTLKEQGFEFEDYFELIRTSAAKRNLIDRDIRSKVSITDDDVKNYFYNHYTKKSAAPMSYKVSIISISPQNFKSGSAARDVADRALRDIRGGEAFEEVAKRVSDDPSAQSGGDLGTMTDDQMSPVIRDALKKLQIGQVSEVLGTASSRFFILKLVDVTSSESDRYNKMKEEIRGQLAASEYQHQIQLWLERQRQNAFIHKAGDHSITGITPLGR